MNVKGYKETARYGKLLARCGSRSKATEKQHKKAACCVL